MTSLFGFSMDSISHVVAGAFLVVTAVLLVLAARNRLFVKLGLRNIPRRRAQSVLIVFGLMLSTLIITSAFATGDTLSYSIRAYAVGGLGGVDEIVAPKHVSTEGSQTTGATFLPQFAVRRVGRAVARSGQTDGVTGIVDQPAALQDLTTRQSKSTAAVVGAPIHYGAAFGNLKTLTGTTVSLDGLRPWEVYINRHAADALNARAGDRIRIFVDGQAIPTTVGAVVANSGLASGGLSFGNLATQPEVVMPLARLQHLTGHPGQISAVLISNRGDTLSGASRTHAVRALVTPVLHRNESIVSVKADALAVADRGGSEFTAGFITFGLFSIASGIMLIVLIFMMLAAERRSEMGVARAVGTKRRHLIQQFLFEGYVYDLGAALVGCALGIVVGLGLVSVMASLLSQPGVGFTLQRHIELRSLVVAFCLGALVTFMSVAGSAWWVSRLSIVAAIRDVPDDLQHENGVASAFRRPVRDLRRAWLSLQGRHPLGALRALGAAAWHVVAAFRVFVARGPILLLLGYWLLQMGSADKQAFPFMLGISLMLVGAAMLLRWLMGATGVPDRLRNRIGFSLAGLSLVVFWLLPFDFFRSDLQVGIEMFFLSGIMLILGGVWTVMYNIDLILAGLLAVLGGVRRLTPILRTAVTYPTQHRLRTGMTLFMFSLVVFALTVEAVLTGSHAAQSLNLNRDVGGYQIYGTVAPNNTITNLNERIAAYPGLRGRITGAGGMAPIPIALRDSAATTAQWHRYVANVVDDAYLAGTRYTLHDRATGFTSDRQVWAALRSHPGDAVIDASLVPVRKGASEGGFQIAGLHYEDRTFRPVRMQMRDRRTNSVMTLRVIGVLDNAATNVPGTSGVYVGRSTLAAVHDPLPVSTTYVFRVAPGNGVHAAALALGSAFLSNGLDVQEFATEYAQNRSLNVGFNNMLFGFMALGLIVGIAALGVIATRSVVERRQQIGMLRAIGFKGGMVRTSFLLESTFVAVLGTGIGVLLGILLGHQVVDYFGRNDPSLHFVVPWLQIAGIALAAYLASLLTTYLPAWQASRVEPAEALRYE